MVKKRLADNNGPKRSEAELVAWFFENACPDHHVRGGPDHVMALHTALNILNQNPEIACKNFYTAVVCGEVDEVERILSERPQVASEKSSPTGRDRSAAGGSGDRFRKDVGPRGWEPLLYLCFTRLPLPAVSDNAVDIARVLLDNGADPNAYFTAGDSRYTPLVGIIGEGEEHRPAHPQREALTKLLLERGAEPYDLQVLYNLHFRGDVLWFLELIYAQAVKLGRQADWDDPNWSMLDMGNYGCGARYLLDVAIANNNVKLAEWLLEHGANPNAPPARDERLSQQSLYEDALRQGFTELAEVLVRFGAEPSAPVLKGEAAFGAACLRLDREEARSLVARHPECLHAFRPMMVAAKQDRADVIDLLLQLGMSPDIADSQSGTHALHVAAYHDSASVAALLIERGAKVDPVDSVHGSTPLWFAIWDQRPRTIELLSRFSRDVWSLSFTGNVERLREVLAAEPMLARLAGGGESPLMYLPGDEERAVEIVEMFLTLGADPSIPNKDGMTAADLARKRGLVKAAALLDLKNSSQG